MLSPHAAKQDNTSIMFVPHMSSPLSSSQTHLSPSPPSTPTSSIARYTYRHDCIMSSPCKPLRQPFTAKTPRRLQTRSTHTTPKSTGRLESPIIMSHGSNLKNRFSGRMKKPNPLILQRGSVSQQDDRETRRILFLNQVKEASQDKRWRGLNIGTREEDERILRDLWVAEKKKWHEQRTREAQMREIPNEFEDWTSETRSPDYEFAEIEAFLEDDQTNIPQTELRGNTNEMGFGVQLTNRTVDEIDDDEYDQIFMEFIKHENKNLNQSHNQLPLVEDHEMVDFS